MSGDEWQNLANQNNLLALQNQQGALTQGGNLSNSINSNINNYGVVGNNYEQQADTAYQDLANTPGYNTQQTAGIEGNPNAAFQYYNPQSTTDTVNAGNAGVNSQVSGLQTGLGQNISDYTGNLNSATSQLQSGVTGAAGTAASGIEGVAPQELQYQGGVYDYLNNAGQQQTGDLSTGLDSAVSNYGGAINSDIDPSKLTVGSDFSNEYQLSPEEQENIKDVAANTTQGQFQTMQDQAAIQAAAQGNTSPAALAAIKQNLGTSGAIAAGQAASQAELSANTEAANRQLTNEQLTLGANQNLTNTQLAQAQNLYGAQANTAATEYGAQSQQSQNLAAQEQAGIANSAQTALAGQEAGGNLNYNAAATAGAAGTSAASQIGQAAVGATEYGGSAGIGAGEYTGQQSTAANEYNQNTGQGLATAADTAGSNRATTVANQAITGQQGVRNYLTGQQTNAQNLQAGYTNSGISNLSAEYGAANQAVGTGNQAISTGSNNQTGNRSTTAGLTSSLTSTAASLFADGGIVTEPTIGIIGERGPEMVVPLSKERVKRYRAPQNLAA